MRTPSLLLALSLGIVTTGCVTQQKTPPVRDVEVLFQKADTDGNGRVSRDEFATFMVSEAFASFDRDGNGFVTEKEFLAAGGTSENFRKINRSGSGSITLEEALASNLVVQTMLVPFDEADINGNGYVTWEEFQAYRKRAQPYTTTR